MDLLTLFYFDAPFRPSHKPLAGIIPSSAWPKVIFMEALAILLFLLTAFLCRKVREFITATESLLKEYRAELKAIAGEEQITD
jgi:hypothetical protein